MADSKISALSALTALEATDEFVVVEKSDTAMAASGTDKRITYQSLVANFTTVIRAVDYGVVANGADMLTGMNAAIAALNADNEAKLILPSGVIGLSAEPDAITGTDIAIESEGFTLLAMTSGAGAAGTFFTIGTSGTTANRVLIKGEGLRLQNNNTAPSGPQIEVAKATDVVITPGMTVLGGESVLHIGTVALCSRVYVGQLTGAWRGNLGGKVIRNIRASNVTLEDWVVTSTTDANVAGSCYLEITAPDAGVHNDSGFYKNLLIQGPSVTQGAEKGVVVNSTSTGHIVNHWFVGGAFDGTQVSGVEIIENSASSTEGYIRQFIFDGTRFVTNAGKIVDLQRTNTSWIQDISFNGAFFGFQRPTGTKATSKPFTHTESAAGKVLGVHYNGCHLRDDESTSGLVGKATIFSFGHSYWSLTGNVVSRVLPGTAGACDSFFETTADVDNFVVTGNNPKHGLSSAATFSVENAYASYSANRVVENNVYGKPRPKTLFSQFASVGNVSTGVDDLHTNTLAAGQLATNGDMLNLWYGGTFALHATATRQVRLLFGGTEVFSTNALTSTTAQFWTLQAQVIRVSASVVRVSSMLTRGATAASGVTFYSGYFEVTGLTLANTQIIKLTGEAAAAGAATDDIICKQSSIAFQPAA